MKLIVTGGAGFMGSAFIRYLIKEDFVDQVINYDLLTYAGKLENLKEVESDKRYKFVKGNIKDGEIVKKVVLENEIDTIVNFAAETYVDRSIENPNIFLETNILGTHSLIQVVTELDLRFHHISTDEVYGALDLESKDRFNEKTRYDPQSPYSASKAGSDHLVQAYFNTYGTRVTISNSSNNFGPYQFPEKFIPLSITNLLNNKKIPMYGDGLYVRDWLYVDDHAKAIWTILTKGTIGQSYCLGGEAEKSNLEVAKTILKLLGKDESMIEYVEDRKGHDRRYAVDISKIKDELGWKPEMNFEEGIKKTIDFYRA